MRLIITPTPCSATRLAAHQIATLMKSRSRPVLGLATGRTMEGVYRELTTLHRRNGLSFSKTVTFNLDEYVGLGAEDHRSYRCYMNDHLFRHVDIDPALTHLPNGVAPDLEAECLAYEQRIATFGTIDLQLLGIGETGHIGFNEPPSLFDTRTRCVTLNQKTREQNAAMFGGDPEAVPRQALTMGVGTILDASALLMIALGSTKADIVARALEEQTTPEISASAVRLHKNCTIILDDASAAKLSVTSRKQAVYHRN